ncbi:hypothetical protein [Muricoccus pecuniae]|uniref:Drug/metabolite transporter (DMT)-like permease n=1 Tax=Muricoccus pecuniae TaxID=693023 RepID=A0A840YMP8_9PROT|nr:hypothetical protein [Roseomonas pecuniae]MBB5696353.1 drug/metabolite transporter (DMT)-like permease [Roseomonas pecuniae]
MLLALALLWGGSFLFNAVALRDLPPLTLVWLRVALAAATLLVVLRCGFRRKSATVSDLMSASDSEMKSAIPI